MATIKSYTDLSQNKTLSKILPLESADMCYLSEESLVPKVIYNGMAFFNSKEERLTNIVHCWSLAALINILPNGSNIVKEEADTENEKYMCTVGIKDDIISTFADNPVDACYGMILKLNELNLLLLWTTKKSIRKSLK